MIIINKKKFTRFSVEKDYGNMYIFTDNACRTSRPWATEMNVSEDSWYYQKYKDRTKYKIHYGSKSNPTTAVIRGLNNAYPISTMKCYGENWIKSDWDIFTSVIDDEINQIKKDIKYFDNLIIGNFRIGCGGRYAKLPYEMQVYLDEKLFTLGIDNTDKYPTLI